MKILVVNPNTTRSMTGKIEAAARAVAWPGTEIIAVNPAMGPVSIEGYYDEAFCVPGLIEEVRKGADSGAEGFVIACFDDPGLDAARSITTAPVIGIAEAAMHTAALVGRSFSVVGTPARAVATIEHLALRYGFERHCRGVCAAEFSVLALEDPKSDAIQLLKSDIRRVVSEERPDSIILGCAGIAGLSKALSHEFDLPVIDGVIAAVKLTESLAGLGIGTSKANSYAPPLPKPYTGIFARHALLGPGEA